jgi:hypothetical protein
VDKAEAYPHHIHIPKTDSMNMTKLFTSALLLFAFAASSTAQNAEASLSTSLPKITNKVDAPAATPVGKEVVISFVNTCGRPVAIFAGPKENIRAPRIETYGGLSRNMKFYLHENEVVCLMALDKRPTACTVIKPGVTTVEVNTTADGIVGK